MRSYRSRGSLNGNGISSAVVPNVNTIAPSNNGHNNNNNSFSNSNSSSQNLNLSSTEPSKFANIKIEESSASLLENCSYVPTTTATGTTISATVSGAEAGVGVVDKKPDTTRGLMNAFITGPIMQHQQETNWNYLTDASGNGVNSATSITVTCETTNAAANDTLYNELVECVNAANVVQQSTSSTHTHHNQTNADEEDEDPIHTFLNMESYFEKELITLIQQEDMIYNYSNQNYRNVKLKLETWDEIARKLKKPGESTYTPLVASTNAIALLLHS